MAIKINTNINMDKFMVAEKRIWDIVSYIFGKYDMRLYGQSKMQNLVNYCIEDINAHPAIIDELVTDYDVEFYVMQSIIKLIPNAE